MNTIVAPSKQSASNKPVNISHDMEMRNTNARLINKLKDLNELCITLKKERDTSKLAFEELRLTKVSDAEELKKAANQIRGLKENLAASYQDKSAILLELNELKESSVHNQEAVVKNQYEVDNLASENQLLAAEGRQLKAALKKNKQMLKQARTKIQSLEEMNQMLQLSQHQMLKMFSQEQGAVKRFDSSKQKSVQSVSEKKVKSRLSEKFQGVSQKLTSTVGEKIKESVKAIPRLQLPKKQKEENVCINLPGLNWFEFNACQPIQAGLYYVSNGYEIGLAMYDTNKKRFIRTESNIAIDYWCYIDNSPGS